MAVNTWPADYPTHIQVPPADATPINAQLFRFVDKIPADHFDFLASYKDPQQKKLVKKFGNMPKFYATSFFSDFSRIEKLINESPEKFKRKIVAIGDVTPQLGLGQADISGHVSLWFYDGQYPNGFTPYA